MMLAIATSVEPAGTLGAELKFTCIPGANGTVPADARKTVPDGVFEAISQRMYRATLPDPTGTLSGELNTNVFEPETGLTLPVRATPVVFTRRQFVRFETLPLPVAPIAIGSDVTVAPVARPVNWTVATVTPVPGGRAIVTGVTNTCTFPYWTTV
jgi:hypothetical protein